ncbi:hypothetical protein L6E12_01050 [Actinokineospora sp. PR83]|uniref:hypothetical protein n=1 Tax=Actinokineospora sp. PR83 TaxID=2884908 RepID=UPI001F401AA9|nr:hypothetical protein [Actinokineospora sp. PR83]MCG8914384.1 hypothetical protein [Actinokineospora sp. PR83]
MESRPLDTEVPGGTWVTLGAGATGLGVFSQDDTGYLAARAALGAWLAVSGPPEVPSLVSAG